MSDKWPETNEEVPLLKFNGEGVLRDLGIDPEERPKKAPAKKKASKKVTVDTGATSKKGGSSRATATAHDKGKKKKKSSTATSKCTRRAGSRALESGATPSSIPADEKEKDREEEEAAKLITGKRSREEIAAEAKPAEKVVGPKTPEKVKGVELEKPKEPTVKKTKFIIKPPRTSEKEVEKTIEEPAGDVIPEKVKAGTETAATTQHNETQGTEDVHIKGLNQPFKRKELEVAPKGASSAGTGALGSGAGEGSKWSMAQTPIGPKDTLGDIYYQTYTEEARDDAPHQPVWGLKQKDTFVEFGACRDWFLGYFPPGEVNRKSA
ncbi:hypothetical protein Hanom_Chr05g00403751 [Helianthus anomalus]